MDPRSRAPAPVPPPDIEAEPDGYLVEVGPAERIHFLDWGGPAPWGVDETVAAEPSDAAEAAGGSPVLLIHGLKATAWSWTAVARRLRRVRRVVALDLRGHGLSDAPTEGYTRDRLADDVIAVVDGAIGAGSRVVLVGHGYGGIVAAWAAERLGDRCLGLVLVDGGWQDLGAETGLAPDEWLRDLEEPPEVLRSMRAFLVDRSAFDPASWDADEERAARATVVEVPAGKLVPAVRPHALAGSVEAIFAYRPELVLPGLSGPIVAVVAAEDEEARKRPALAALDRLRRLAGRPAIVVVDLPDAGHNLPRYRPAEVAGAILGVPSAR